MDINYPADLFNFQLEIWAETLADPHGGADGSSSPNADLGFFFLGV